MWGSVLGLYGSYGRGRGTVGGTAAHHVHSARTGPEWPRCSCGHAVMSAATSTNAYLPAYLQHTHSTLCGEKSAHGKWRVRAREGARERGGRCEPCSHTEAHPASTGAELASRRQLCRHHSMAHARTKRTEAAHRCAECSAAARRMTHRQGSNGYLCRCRDCHECRGRRVGEGRRSWPVLPPSHSDTYEVQRAGATAGGYRVVRVWRRVYEQKHE